MKEEEIKDLQNYLGKRWDDMQEKWEDSQRDVDHVQLMLPRPRQIGKTAEILALIADLKAQGKTVFVIGKDDPPPTLLGAKTPFFGDPDLDVVDGFREATLDCMGANFHLIVANRPRLGKTMLPMNLAMEFAPKPRIGFPDSFDLNGGMYDFKTDHKDFGIIPDILKTAETREKPKTKHNPRPNRMAFLDGLGNRKRKF